MNARSQDATIIELADALRDMIANFRPFTFRPIGAEGSAARLEQEAQIAAYQKAKNALKYDRERD